jgi:hypothetical protein
VRSDGTSLEAGEPRPGRGFEPVFEPFPKIRRLRRETVITEKIDGTNAAVGITEDGRVYAQSRKRIITVDVDNHGFARWVSEHADGLRDELGPGLHFGEWWGLGIQRGYGLDEKRFSLFNTIRWRGKPLTVCHVVPVLAHVDAYSDDAVEEALAKLRRVGRYAAPGYDNPEGIVVFHRASNTPFKVTLTGDDYGKEHES